jgi:cell division septal protein FtsQ
MKTFKNKSGHKTWRNIQQRLLAPCPTQEAAQRRWVHFLRYAGVVVAVALVLAAGVGLYRHRSAIVQLAYPGQAFAVKRLELDFRSDGLLSAQWAKRVLGPSLNQALMHVDVFALKAMLEQTPQVKQATVVKHFPGTLQVVVKEYVPIARVVIQLDKKQAKQFLVSAEGKVFFPAGYPRSVVQSLPFLQGVVLKQCDVGQFESLLSLEKLAELLRYTRVHHPHLYAQWTLLHCEQAGKPEGPFINKIRIKTTKGSEWLFDPDHVSTQVERLVFILRECKAQGKPFPRKVDLSYASQAVVGQ